jgi:hypothetical protein
LDVVDGEDGGGHEPRETEDGRYDDDKGKDLDSKVKALVKLSLLF